MKGELRRSHDGKVISLESSCVIGRSPESDVRLESQQVSREHALIRLQSTGYWLYDLDSANGTTHNDRVVVSPVPLQSGDRIGVADEKFEFVDREPHSSGAMAPWSSDTVIGMRKAPLIVLVTDIVNFTGLSAGLTEEGLAEVLHVWYRDCSAVMEESGGLVDKFMGDGMLGYWPETTGEVRAAAVEAARAFAQGPLQRKPELAQMLGSEGGSMRCGVGLHLGDAALGTVARGTRTALGDAVNVAFRLEAFTRAVDASVIASEAFFEGWETGRDAFESLGRHQLKGIPEPLELWGLEA